MPTACAKRPRAVAGKRRVRQINLDPTRLLEGRSAGIARHAARTALALEQAAETTGVCRAFLARQLLPLLADKGVTVGRQTPRTYEITG